MREPNLKYLALENMARLAEVPAVVDTGAGRSRSRRCSRWAALAAGLARLAFCLPSCACPFRSLI